MPKQSKWTGEIPVIIPQELVSKIQELADLSGRTFDEEANEVINEVLTQELPRVIAEAQARQRK